jgi:hypothetical protein
MISGTAETDVIISSYDIQLLHQKKGLTAGSFPFYMRENINLVLVPLPRL